MAKLTAGVLLPKIIRFSVKVQAPKNHATNMNDWEDDSEYCEYTSKGELLFDMCNCYGNRGNVYG